jgi:hypothetical protein
MSVFIDLNIEGSPDRNRMLASLEPALVRALTFINVSNQKFDKATKFYRYGKIVGNVYKVKNVLTKLDCLGLRFNGRQLKFFEDLRIFGDLNHYK